MRSYLYSSFCLLRCARQMFTKSDVASFKTEYHHKRKAINLTKLVASDLLINKKLGNNEPIEDNQWHSVRKEMLQKHTDMNEVNVDSQVYDICLHFGRVDLCINYYKFLERNKYPLNLATNTTYLRLMGLKMRQSQAPLTKDEEKSIIKVYDKIIKEYDILDPRSASYCIAGLSLTKKWEQCFKLLEMIKFIQKPGPTEVSTIIAAAFRNNRDDLAWQMIDEYSISMPLQPCAYTEYLNYCKRNFSKDKLVEELEKMFFAWRKYNIKPKNSTVCEYEELFKSIGYTAKHTSITEKGICNHCKTALKPVTLTKGDFRILSSAILNSLIVGKDVYRNTSPQELKNYLIFLQTMKPYDVIIDGLNVAYACRGDGERKGGSIENVLYVVNYFRKRNKRTLVVGRVHMKWWKSKGMKSLEDITDVFYTKNLSQDDPFLLHITLSSGSETCFVSRDFMRQHKFKLEDPALKQLFKNWQISHQYLFYPVANSRINSMKVVEPLQYDPSAQKGDEGWHIPYTTHQELSLPDSPEPPENWLCLKHEKQKKC